MCTFNKDERERDTRSRTFNYLKAILVIRKDIYAIPSLGIYIYIEYVRQLNIGYLHVKESYGFFLYFLRTRILRQNLCSEIEFSVLFCIYHRPTMLKRVSFYSSYKCLVID